MITNRLAPLLLSAATIFQAAGSTSSADPVAILKLPKSGVDPARIDYAKLPTLSGTHAVISHAARNPLAKDKRDLRSFRFELHNYLVHHDGRFWCIWSDGPAIEDEPTQEIRYATSKDGLKWSRSAVVTGRPEKPYALIARGLWVRDGKLLALAARFKGKGAFGVDKELQLQAYVWDRKAARWRFKGKVYDNTINNFPPQRLPSGDWILTRRDARFNVSILIGGRKALNDWQSFPVVGVRSVGNFRPDEPIFWPLPDKTLFALFRDNGGSLRLFHATSKDSGRSWSMPVITNFPNATSKVFSLQTSRGYRVLLLNANPGLGRRELHLAVSRNGRVFTRLARLKIPTPPNNAAVDTVSLRKKFQSGIASLQYPHVIERDGYLFIAFSRLKVQTELYRVSLDDVETLLRR